VDRKWNAIKPQRGERRVRGQSILRGCSVVALLAECTAEGVQHNRRSKHRTGKQQVPFQRMAEAMKHAVIAGREAYLAGRIAKKLYATASSPLEGVVR